MTISFEIDEIDKEMEAFASLHGMQLASFLDNLDKVDSNVAATMIPLLVRRLNLLRQAWKNACSENGFENVFPFSGIRI